MSNPQIRRTATTHSKQSKSSVPPTVHTLPPPHQFLPPQSQPHQNQDNIKKSEFSLKEGVTLAINAACAGANIFSVFMAGIGAGIFSAFTLAINAACAGASIFSAFMAGIGAGIFSAFMAGMGSGSTTVINNYCGIPGPTSDSAAQTTNRMNRRNRDDVSPAVPTTHAISCNPDDISPPEPSVPTISAIDVTPQY